MHRLDHPWRAASTGPKGCTRFVLRRPGRRSALLTTAITVFAGVLTFGQGVSSAKPAIESVSAAHTAASPMVKTPDGTLTGVKIGAAQAFLGVPFAKPPTYALRWLAPQAPTPWSGVRDATHLPPACLQFAPAGVLNNQPTSEDCLYLNVYRPAGATSKSKLPVMLFYHGGANTQGTADEYGGQTMASRTNTIIISTNYRLGALGFLALPGLDAENPKVGSGDYAVLDQIQTLKWIHRSIASFGGNPEHVTIFGQSAGAMAVCNMLASPKSKGLFQRAIIESFDCSAIANPAKTAEVAGATFAAAAGCPGSTGVVACLRDAWAPNLVSAAQTISASTPVTGGSALPLPSGAAIAAGRWNKVPVIIGGVRSEGKLFNIASATITAPQYEQLIATSYKTNAPAILAKYPAAAYSMPFYALAAVSTDSGVACSVNTTANLLVGKTPVYRYEFNDPTSPTLFGYQPTGIDMSNAHSAELAYLFDFTFGDRPLTKTEKQLAYQMQDYWAAFARNGNPHAKDQAAWPQYTAAASRTLVIAPSGNYVNTGIADEHNCSFWANLPKV